MASVGIYWTCNCKRGEDANINNALRYKALYCHLQQKHERFHRAEKDIVSFFLQYEEPTEDFSKIRVRVYIGQR